MTDERTLNALAFIVAINEGDTQGAEALDTPSTSVLIAVCTVLAAKAQDPAASEANLQPLACAYLRRLLGEMANPKETI
jgi:hypothetical protein